MLAGNFSRSGTNKNPSVEFVGLIGLYNIIFVLLSMMAREKSYKSYYRLRLHVVKFDTTSLKISAYDCENINK